MRIGIIAFSDRGGELAARLLQAFREMDWEAEGFLSHRHRRAGLLSFADLREITGRLWRTKEILIFVGACGIAVRAVAPYIKSKTEDPGVLAVDECGVYVVSLLSGHVGFANALTQTTARILNAAPVITTATDRNGVFAVDEWAARHFLRIMEPKAVLEISSRLLAGEDVGICSELPVTGVLPAGLVLPEDGLPQAGIVISGNTAGAGGRFSVTCHLLPMDLTLGMGCRKGKDFQSLQEFVDRILRENGLCRERVGMLCSIREKSEEPGLLELARYLRATFRTYTGETLSLAESSFTASAFVKDHMGVDNVCERSAFLGSGNGRKLIGRQAENGMTLAIYQREMRLAF